MKPEIVLQDGRTEASALLFAHDGKRATEVLRYTYTEVEETRQSEILEKKHKEFINFVIKDWIAEMTTETSVTLEFMDRSERNSITSSIDFSAVTGETEELMADEHTENTGERQNDLQGTFLTVSSEIPYSS